MKQSLLALAVGAAILLHASNSFALYDLQITEIWFGNDPGSNLTDDWFEVTNVGNMPWTAATDGAIWFDDSPPTVANATVTTGIASIAPGESVIYTHGGAAAVTTWSNLWDDVISPLPQIGSHTSGAGLGAGGDGVAIWISIAAPVGAAYRFESFPSATGNGGRSYDTVLDAFSTAGNAAGAVATTVLNNQSQAAVGSPGTVVPEPTTAGLAAVALLGLGGVRRKIRRG